MKNYLNFILLVSINNLQSGCQSSKIKTNDNTKSKQILLNCPTSPTHTNHNSQSDSQSFKHENNFTIVEENTEYSQPEMIDNNNINIKTITYPNDKAKPKKPIARKPHTTPYHPQNISQPKFNAQKKIQTTSRIPNANKTISKSATPKFTPSSPIKTPDQQKKSTITKRNTHTKKRNTKTQQTKISNSYNLPKNKCANKQPILPAKKKTIPTAKTHAPINHEIKKKNSSNANIRNKKTYDNEDMNIKTEYINNINLETMINKIKEIEREIKKKCLIGNNYETLLKSFITNDFENFEDILIMINKNQNSTYKFFIYDNLEMPKSTKDVPLKPLIIFTQQIYCKHIIEHLKNITKTQHKNVKIILVDEQKFFGTIVALKKWLNIHIQIE